jgi:uncharacterized membrane protein
MRSRRRWTAGVTTVAGLAILAGAAVTVVAWRPELPDPVASHWGPGGVVNGYSSVDAVLRIMLIGGSVLVLGFGAMTGWLGHAALTRRVGAGATIWSALFVSTLTVGSLDLQRGLSDAGEAGSIDRVVLFAFVGALVAAIVVAVLVPGDPHQPTASPVDGSAPRVALAPGQPVSWTGTAASPAAIVTGLVVAAALLALTLLAQVWVLLAVAAVVFVLIAAMSSAVVQVDDRGVTVRSPVGWPRTRVPLDEVVRADVIEVRPVRDFGGWGWRVGRHGRVGIALRRGEALLVERTGGRSLAVTVDGAAQAAGLVNALADRARRP